MFFDIYMIYIVRRKTMADKFTVSLIETPDPVPPDEIDSKDRQITHSWNVINKKNRRFKEKSVLSNFT